MASFHFPGYPGYGGHYYGASPTSPHVPAYPTARVESHGSSKHDVFGAAGQPSLYTGMLCYQHLKDSNKIYFEFDNGVSIW